jgi:hypothetical protein
MGITGLDVIATNARLQCARQRSKLRCDRMRRLSSQAGVAIWYGGPDSQELPGLREPLIGRFNFRSTF